MDQFVYDLLSKVGFAHPLHPVLITMVVGPVIASFLFTALALFLGKAEYAKTGRQLTVVGFIFWFPTVAVGLIDWVHFYGGSPKMAEISTKLVLAGLLFVVLLANILLFKVGQNRPALPLVFTLLATVLVSALGYYGGEIVFGSSAPKAESTAPAAVAAPAADGFKSFQQDGYTLKWKIHDQVIDVRVSHANNGWVGVGFGTTGTMEGSHILLGFVLDGKATVVDHFGYARDAHGPQDKVGGKSTITNVGGETKDGTTTLWFTLPLNTGNPKDPVLVEGQSYKVLLANGGEDANDLVTYHERSGRLVVDLTL